MKTSLLCFIFCLLTLGLFAQETKVEQKISSVYDRSSVTILLLDFSQGSHYTEVKEKMDKIVFADKYYNNNVNYLFLPAPFDRGVEGVNEEELIKQSLESKKIATDIISKWYSRKDDGSMSLELVHERGMFNATDAAAIQAKSTKRGNAQLEDYGNRLINLSYILVLDYKDVKTMTEANMDQFNGWKATVIGYLYKIDYNAEIQNTLYDAWIYDDDTPQVKEEKKKKFDQIQFPITYVAQTEVIAIASQLEGGSQLGRFIKQKSLDQLLSEMVQKGYEESLYYLEKKYEDFRVKTPIYQTNPLRVKIGKKEGVKTDNRYFAYEYVYDENTNTSKQKFRGVIRSTSNIVDNRQVATGDMGTTKFYQTSGRKLHTGYLLQQRNDYGVEVGVGYEAGNIGGIHGRIDARLGRYIGIKSLFLYLEGGAQVKNYDDVFGNDYKNIGFVHGGAGLAKGFMLTRNVELRPYLGGGLEMASNTDMNKATDDKNGYSLEGLKAIYAKGGANLALNLKHNIQIIGGMGFYSFIGYPSNSNGDVIEENWNKIFKDRSGASALVAFRIGF